jgi:ribosomal protein RSM22 (predicted rRNA methylase)
MPNLVRLHCSLYQAEEMAQLQQHHNGEVDAYCYQQVPSTYAGLWPCLTALLRTLEVQDLTPTAVTPLAASTNVITRYTITAKPPNAVVLQAACLHTVSLT